MNGIIDSPFFKIFATTNSLLLGAGALYLVSFGRESGLCATDQDVKFQGITSRNHICLDEAHKSTEHQGDILDQIKLFDFVVCVGFE